MSTETKIGLIIGLGFIVCFAVLLANTDPEQTSAVQWTHVVDGATTTKIQPRPHTQPLRAKPASGSSEVRRPIPRLRPQPPPIHENRGPLPKALPVPVNHPDTSDTLVDAGRSTSETINSHVINAAQLDTRLRQYLNDARKSSQSSPVPAGESLELHAIERETAQDRPKNTPVQAPTRIEAPARLVRHTVVAGDTLSKIARQYYASSSHKVIDAIFGANRAILPSPDRLLVGMTLSLPHIDGLSRLASTRTGAADIPPARSTQGTARSSGKLVSSKWYQIQKNDRYVSIARTELGDGSRWKEIHELNKDRFPDPGKIQWGVRIRLPALHPAMAGRP